MTEKQFLDKYHKGWSSCDGVTWDLKRVIERSATKKLLDQIFKNEVNRVAAKMIKDKDK